MKDATPLTPPSSNARNSYFQMSNIILSQRTIKIELHNDMTYGLKKTSSWQILLKDFDLIFIITFFSVSKINGQHNTLNIRLWLSHCEILSQACLWNIVSQQCVRFFHSGNLNCYNPFTSFYATFYVFSPLNFLCYYVLFTLLSLVIW